MVQTNNVGFIRKVIIREGYSSLVTKIYSGLGYVDRKNLATQLNGLNRSSDNIKTYLDSLVAGGALKARFVGEALNGNRIEPYMLRRLNASEVSVLGPLGVNLEPVIPHRWKENLFQGIERGYESAYGFAVRKELTLSRAFYAGAVAASAIFLTQLGTGESFWEKMTAISGATAAVTALAYGASKRLPPSSLLGGEKARQFSRLAVAASTLATGVGISTLVYETNMNLVNLFDAVGFAGTFGFSAALALWPSRILARNLAGFRDAYGSKLDPGSYEGMRRLLTAATLSVVFEAHYLAVRTFLLGASSAYIIDNSIKHGYWQLAAYLPLLVTLPATHWLRNAKNIDGAEHLKMYLPAWGALAGLGLAAGQAINERNPFPIIAYATMLGSTATFFLSELHGGFHSINTNNGFIRSLQASSRDLLGEQEARKLTGGDSILVVNPFTGNNEQSYGITYSTLLARKPGLVFIEMYDRVLTADKGFISNYQNQTKHFNWVRENQAKIFTDLHDRVAQTGPLTERYQVLAEQLDSVAEYFETGLRERIKAHVKANSGWFDKDVEEYLRGADQELFLRAQAFREVATRLRLKADKGYISAKDFSKEWTELLECYDPELVTVIQTNRKEMAGDEWKVRKVENVATHGLFRGMTLYKGWRTEKENPLHPTADWISGSWTRIRNPEFQYGAPKGTLEGAKYIWIEAELALTPLQKTNRDVLSTNDRIASVNNEPSEGFVKGTIPLEIDLNTELNGGQKQTVTNYYFTDADTPQTKFPKIRNINFRAGQTELAPDYQLGTFNNDNGGIMEPITFAIPAYKYTLMMDKNDIQVNSYVIHPATLAKEAKNKYVNLLYAYPFEDSTGFDDPHPDKQLAAVNIFDANIELVYAPEKGKARVIPFKPDRSAAHAGRTTEVKTWQTLSGAEVRPDGTFALIYDEAKGKVAVELPPSARPEFLASLELPVSDKPIILAANNFTKAPQREGDMSWYQLTYTDGTVAFVRCPDGKRPVLFNKSGGQS
ncbi:MAG: hypothetical protein WC551_11845 [Patescibacteria group bacterium]